MTMTILLGMGRAKDLEANRMAARAREVAQILDVMIPPPITGVHDT
jgi:hypothetical protein